VPHQNHNRRFLVTLVAFGIFSIPFARNAGAEDARPPGQAGSTAASENAQLRSELEQLKQVVLEQQARINALEHQQAAGTTLPSPRRERSTAQPAGSKRADPSECRQLR